MTTDRIIELSALDQAALIRGREISSEELVRVYLERIARLNPHLAAFVATFPRRALRAARRKDAQSRGARASLPPFHGVPIGIKDLNVVRWTVTRWGSRAARPIVAPVDDYTVASLRHAGFVIVGKLATSELGALPVTEPDIHPPTRNPWSVSHSAGGSSGGSGAAVAAALVPVAQGSDGAGSLRIPAAFNHLFTIKASRGVVRNQFGIRDPRVLYTSGPITRTVDDAAALLDAMARSRESFQAIACVRPRRMRINFVCRTPLCATDPDVERAFVRAVGVLADLGHFVDESTIPPATLDEFLPIWQRQVGHVPFVRWNRAQPITRWLGEAGRTLDPHDVATRHDELSTRFSATLAAADLWATPTVPVLPPEVGAFANLPPDRGFNELACLGSFTAIANVTGQPAVSIPIGLSRNGLPIGMQLIGAPRRDGELLAVSREFEAAMPWRDRHPPGLV